MLRCLSLLLLSLWSATLLAVEVARSPNDPREYRYLQLPNQLQVLLISDPATDKAAAALDVFAGSADDPLDRQGLAHFLEHMLFLGTEKYPEPDGYQEFINEHGGSHNAYTSFEHTNYFFDIDPDHLAQGLDRFAQFFTSPLFNAKYVERERNAVHSEYQARLKDEFRRTLDVYQQVMNPEHPLTKFSVGNLTTLANEEGDLREDLIAFFAEHYNARDMALVVLGKQSLDALEKMVVPRFGNIPNRERAEARAATPEADQGAAKVEPMFRSQDLPMRLAIKPEKESRQLSLLFPIPPVDELYRRKPTHYLGNLFGHEGEGSLLSILKHEGWAEALSAGVFLSSESNALFRVNISLTQEGLAQQESIVVLVFAAIDRIARKGVEEWRYRELQRLGEIAFRFQEKAEPLVTVRSLAPNLHYYEAADLIAGDYLLQEYDPELIKHFAAFLNPDNVVINLTAPSVETDQVSDYFRTPYRVETAPMELAELSSTLRKKLELPGPNPFIPENLSLKPRPVVPSGGAERVSDEPMLIKDAARIRVWFKQDEKFQVPRATTYLRILSPQAAESLRDATLMQLYVEMVRDALNEYAYPARLAGLFYSLQSNSRGLDVLVTGYDDGQDQLFRRIVEQLHTPRFSEERFENIKRQLTRRWQNSRLDPPYEQLMAAMPTLLFSPWWSREQHLKALEEIQFKDLNGFAKRVFLDSRADMLAYGNITRSEAAKLAGLVEVELLSAMANKVLPPARVVKLEPVSLDKRAPVFAREVPHEQQAALLYVQGNDDSLTENAFMMLLRQVIRSPFFHQLRTEQQLGYVVFASPLPFKDVPGTIMVVQSPAASPERLMNAIETFTDSAQTLVPDQLAQHKSAVVNQLLEAPENLHQQASRFWSAIVNADADFHRRERLAEAVKAINPDELRNYLATTLVDRPRALWFVAGPEVFASEEPDENTDEEAAKPASETSSEATATEKGESGMPAWMPLDQWPAFKAERESYIYP